MSTSFRLLLPRQLLDEMIAHAYSELPNECCGLLAGKMGTKGTTALAVRRYSLVNELASPTAYLAMYSAWWRSYSSTVNEPASPIEYLSDPQSMFVASKDMRRHSLDVLAVYHSHPTTDPVPSKKDRERNYLGEVMHFIVGLHESPPPVRGWWLTGDDYRDAEWEVV